MSKMMKVIGKLKLWTLIGAVLIVAGIVIAAVFGFHADPTIADSRTLSVRLDSYVTDARTEYIEDVCEEEIDRAGLGDKYSTVNEFSGTGCEIVHTFSSGVSEESLNGVKDAVETRLSEATETQDSVLYGAFVYVMANAEDVSAVLPSGYLWRGILAGAVILVIEFIYVSVRYKLNMGVTAAAASLAGTLLAVALVALVRIPVTTSIIYVAAFALLYTTLLSLVIFGQMRTNFKSDEYKEKTAEEAVASSVPVKAILLFAAATAIVLAVTGIVATAAVRWFALSALVGVISALYASLLFLPAMYLPLKKSSDKRAALRARYDYKKESRKDKKAAAKAAEKAAEKTDAPASDGE